MMKKLLIAIVVCMLLSAVLFLFLYFRDLRPYANHSSFKAIPQEAGCIVIFNHPKATRDSLMQNPEFLSHLRSIPLIHNMLSIFMDSDTTKVDIRSTWTLLSEKPIVFSFSNLGNENVYSLLHQFKNRQEEKLFLKLLKSKESDMALTEVEDSGSDKWFSLASTRCESVLYFVIIDGLFMSSPSLDYLKKSVSNFYSGRNAIQDPSFQRLMKTASVTSAANLFIHIRNFPALLYPFTIDTVESRLSFFNRLGEWAELDVEVKGEELMFSGLIPDSVHATSLGLLLQNTDPGISSIYRSFPYNTCYFLSYNFGLTKQLRYRNLLDYYTSLNRHDNYPDSLFELIEDEIALVHSRIPSSSEINNYLIIKIKSPSDTEMKLFHLLASEPHHAQPVTWFKPDEESSFPIYQGFINGSFSKALEGLFYRCPDGFYTFFDNYLIFSNSIESLSSIIYDNLLEKTLDNQRAFQDYLTHFGTRENVMIYVSPSYLPELFTGLADDGFIQTLVNNRSDLKSFFGWGMQIASSNNQLYLYAHLNHEPDCDNEPETVWQSKLDTSVVMKPVFVTNPISGEKEILVQDLNHTLYLLNYAGRTLWKVSLDGRIMGNKIEQIDFFGNGKLQYVFNTGRKLYLMDRNGNHLENFPVTLISPAASSLSVVDYDQRGEYRFFIPSESGHVWLFDKKGNRVSDWKFGKVENRISQSVQHVRIADKDYLIFTDLYKHYVVDRRGRSRAIIHDDFSQEPGTPLYLSDLKENQAEFVTLSTTGELVKLLLPSGATVSKKLDVEEDNLFLKPIHNKAKNLVLTSAKNLYLLDESGNLLWSKSFNADIISQPDVYQFSSNDFKIGVVTSDQSIYLFNSDGSVYEGFPLQGISRFTIGFLKSGLSDFNLIVGGKNNFIYNYYVK